MDLANGLGYAWGMRPADIKKAVKAARKPGESRLQQSKRLGIPYVTLRRMEVSGLMHRNPVLRDGYLAKLTPTTAGAA